MRMTSALRSVPGSMTVTLGVCRAVFCQTIVSLVVGKSRSVPQCLQVPRTVGPFGLRSFQ
jgi:hypothetical protein